jgi:[ribosomal protein S18]-alanine N-acetyltransferase
MPANGLRIRPMTPRGCDGCGGLAPPRRHGVVDSASGCVPDLTGYGLGAVVLATALRHVGDMLHVTGSMLSVAAFNRRAITVDERAGFRETGRHQHRAEGGLHELVGMARGALTSADG